MKKLINMFIVLFCVVAGVIVAILAPFYNWLSYILVTFLPICFVAYFCLGVVYPKNKKIEKIQQLLFLVVVILFFLETIFYIFYLTGILEHFRDIDSAKKWIQSFGAVSFIIYFIIQILQVVILPIPAQITMIAGVLIFGAVQTFIISSVAIVLGSVICFFIGRVFGNKILYLLFDKDVANHYKELLSQKGRIFLPIFFLLPIFPDDLLCFAAGATNMSFKCFFVISLIFRPLAVACICWVGSGKLIPFSSWGIPVWIGLISILFIIVVYLFKYQKQIEEWIVNKFSRIKKD